MGHRVSHQLVRELLTAAGYSLQANRKTREGPPHPDRDAQFRHITAQVRDFQAAGQPVISVDTKKKELVGISRTPGATWRPTGQAEDGAGARLPDPGPGQGHALRGLRPHPERRLGQRRDRPRHGQLCGARRSAGGGRRWGARAIGAPARCSSRRTPAAATAARLRLWKWELQQLANRTGLTITVCHFPPGTSKWNKIEHRLFSYISRNWRGQPLVSLAVIVNLIGATRTAAGLRVRCELDRGTYPKGRTISDAQLASVRLTPHQFHGDWNYTIHPVRRR